jgi:Leucine-rich repeat (LRR) protein
MTELQTLDLSYNDLSDLSGKDVFSLPNNLTNLIISHNHLNHLPWNYLLQLRNLLLLDLEYNDFSNFDEALMNILRNGTILKYIGN